MDGAQERRWQFQEPQRSDPGCFEHWRIFEQGAEREDLEDLLRNLKQEATAVAGMEMCRCEAVRRDRGRNLHSPPESRKRGRLEYQCEEAPSICSASHGHCHGHLWSTTSATEKRPVCSC